MSERALLLHRDGRGSVGTAVSNSQNAPKLPNRTLRAFYTYSM